MLKAQEIPGRCCASRVITHLLTAIVDVTYIRESITMLYEDSQVQSALSNLCEAVPLSVILEAGVLSFLPDRHPNPHLKVAFCSTGSRAGSMCSVMSSISNGRPTLMQFSKDLNSFAFVIVVTYLPSSIIPSVESLKRVPRQTPVCRGERLSLY